MNIEHDRTLLGDEIEKDPASVAKMASARAMIRSEVHRCTGVLHSQGLVLASIWTVDFDKMQLTSEEALSEWKDIADWLEDSALQIRNEIGWWGKNA